MNLGSTHVTATLMAYCEENEINLIPFFQRYNENDWGDLGADDQHANNMDMFNLSGRVLGKYKLSTGKYIYLVTTWNEQERYTVAMFPDEY